MRTIRYGVLVACAAAVVAASAVAAPTKSIPITGTFTGNASTDVSGTTATIVANGTGKVTLLGAGKIVGNGTADTSQQPCTPFGGTGRITAAGGIITFTVPTTSSSCGDEGGHTFAITGLMKVTKATGKLAKAKGSLRFTGTYSHDDGSFSIKLRGSLTK